MTHSSELESRIEALELKNAFQDDVIEQLNAELTVHQSQLAELRTQLQLIATRLKEAPSGGNIIKPEDEPPPPHY